MSEYGTGTTPSGQDPTLRPLRDVIETMAAPAPAQEAVAAVGATATAAAGTVGCQEQQPDAIETVLARDVAHERPKPAHWDELVAFAGTLPALDGNHKDRTVYHESSVDALREKMETLLDNETLDECRYYAIGTMLCGLARELRDPARRQALAAAVGKELVDSWWKSGLPFGIPLTPEQVGGNAASRAFRGMIHAYAEGSPPHIRLLNDLLFWHESERVAAVRSGLPSTEYTFISKKFFTGGSRYEAGEGANKVGDVTAAATGRVLYAALVLRAEHLMNTDPEFPHKPTAQQIIDHTDMDDINLIPVAQRAAAVRLDELSNLEEELLGIDGHGRLYFDGKKLPRSKDLPPPKDISITAPAPLHARRLRCPALFVEGLIPNMMTCLIDGIRAADARANEELALRRATGGA